MDKAQIGAIQLVKAGEDPAKVLELVEAAFDQMALAVEPGIVVAFDLRALMRGNDRFTALRLHLRDEGCPGVAAIRHHFLKRKSVQQRVRLGAVVALPSGHNRPQGIA